MRRSWAVGLLIISILAMACGGAADVDDYKAAFVYLGSANDEDGHRPTTKVVNI